jgi:hypothetical protein
MNERELLVDCLCRLNSTAVKYYLTGPMARSRWGICRWRARRAILLNATVR